ncbi:hypothetical protein BDP67DRAFT_497271 [Colletotrichum lupini]|nr:hypothetical protein BDP67DRAFT_497271 [Colletotrichum lupini]
MHHLHESRTTKSLETGDAPSPHACSQPSQSPVAQASAATATATAQDIRKHSPPLTVSYTTQLSSVAEDRFPRLPQVPSPGEKSMLNKERTLKNRTQTQTSRLVLIVARFSLPHKTPMPCPTSPLQCPATTLKKHRFAGGSRRSKKVGGLNHCSTWYGPRKNNVRETRGLVLAPGPSPRFLQARPGELGTMLKRSLRCSVPPDAVEMQGRHGMANWSFHVVVVAVKACSLLCNIAGERLGKARRSVSDDQFRLMTGKSEKLPEDAVFRGPDCSDGQDSGATFERYERENGPIGLRCGFGQASVACMANYQHRLSLKGEERLANQTLDWSFRILEQSPGESHRYLIERLSKISLGVQIPSSSSLRMRYIEDVPLSNGTSATLLRDIS